MLSSQAATSRLDGVRPCRNAINKSIEGYSMKKSVCGATALLAVLACTICIPPAMAQSQVAVYGIIDTGVVYTTNANAAGQSAFKMPSLTASFPSRLGFKGTE